MGVSSFISGLIPLSVNFSASGLHLVSVFSVGLLISTAFVLIIPEGLEHYTVHEPIGLWLLTGFIVLFSINSITSIFSSNTNVPSQFEQSFQLSHLNDEFIRPLSPPESAQAQPQLERPFVASKREKNMLLAPFKNPRTLGLIIHALTDGIALASSIMSDSDDSVDFTSVFVVFAIFVHKLPTCFALSSLLLASGTSSKEILYHVGVFSSSSPIGAILTYLVVAFVINSNFNEAAGELLIFSGGAFLFVGFHALHETLDHNQSSKDRISQFKGLGLCLLGMIIPAFIALVRDEA
ncbi:putative membrane protein [Ogataea parapolymorpha DL-1]|uniref:Membrane protein n=1 Tax=Ogataea parapolymorpha (strain ATCC 26012 / BCRC 20466 / JCM 22074 / NRRL Y-7560 / DL-1) TaxID=871575 RepID=W1Q9R4_OGAPD|nr:putative membrane protein [Ogataea parapolymorpha DL-1]ESW97104.1 putative membrane protein [Ogataea parapolymorpha DL-1]